MSNQICISNLICLNTYFIIVILLVVILYIILMKQKTKNIVKKVYVDTAKNIIETKYPQDKRPDLYRQMNDVLEEPSKTHFPSRVPINIRTRGAELPYQQVGYIYRNESDPTYNPDGVNTVPLYGRKDHRSSDIWEYYVIPDKNNNIKIELTNNREIFSGDKISVKTFTGEWIAEIYENKEYRYLPYLY